MGANRDNSELRIEGIAVAPGVAFAPALIWSQQKIEIPKWTISEDALPGETARFQAALLATRSELLQIQKQMAESIGVPDASIFDAHLLIVEDRTLLDETLRSVRSNRHNIEFAFHEVADRYCRFLRESNDPYLRERVADIEDVARRVIRHLLGLNPRSIPAQTWEHILVTQNLSPSDTALLDPTTVLGFVSETGGKTSHSAIMARSLGIPSIAGLPNVTQRIQDGDTLILDGYRGMLIVNPEAGTLDEYESYKTEKHRITESLEGIRDESGVTLDSVHIVISANIKLPSDMQDVKKNGAEGVGLFRSEFLFLGREGLPDEEEQYNHYRDVAEKSLPHSVIIRTLDIGGDKAAESLNLPREDYPILGVRAIRLCLERPAIFKPQLRAILRASTIGNLRLMFPMISSLTEFREARAILEECKAELRNENKPFNEKIEIGVMIEVPSAALTSDLLAKEVNFFSIGTNDLIQYTVALDRLNNRVAHLYEPTHPAILRLIRQVVEAGSDNGIWTGTCGEAASDLMLIPLLVGLGIREISVSPMLIPHVKKAIQSVSLTDCRILAEQSLQAVVSSEILELCGAFARKRFGELL